MEDKENGRKETAEEIIKACQIKKGVPFTINEHRKRYGLEPIENGDTPLIML